MGGRRAATWTRSGSARSPRPSGCASGLPRDCSATRGARDRPRREHARARAAVPLRARSAAAAAARDDRRRVPHRPPAAGAAGRGAELEVVASRPGRPRPWPSGWPPSVDDRTSGGARLRGAVRGLADRRGPRRAGDGLRGGRRRAPRRRLPRARLPPVRAAEPERAGWSAAATSTSSSARATAFLRLPPHADELRPALTGWYAEFEELAAEKKPGAVPYPRGAGAFRRLDLRPDEPLPRGARFRLLRRAGPDAGRPARRATCTRRRCWHGSSTTSACPARR